VVTAPWTIDGIHGYAEKVIDAGDHLHLRVSSTVGDVSVELIRLGPGGYFGGADVAMDWEVMPAADVAQPQPVYFGSFGITRASLSGALSALTVECWVRPRRSGRWQGLVAQHDYPDHCSFGLFLDDELGVAFYLGSGGPFEPSQLWRGFQLAPDRWSHVAGTWDGDRVRMYVDGAEAVSADFAGPVAGGEQPLRLGSYGVGGHTDMLLNGDVAMPALHAVALASSTIQRRVEEVGLTVPGGPDVLACWPLTEEGGDRLADVSGHQRHLALVNHGTWMIGGPGFNPDSVAASSAYTASADAGRGHGLRLSADDLVDCRWATTHVVAVPADAPPGVYAVRLRNPHGAFNGDVTFVVRRSRNARRRSMVVVCSTTTWLAYNAPAFSAHPGARDGWGTGSDPVVAVPGSPRASCYVQHADGTPAYYFGMNRPWPMDQAHVTYRPGYSHLVNAELPLHAWLSAAGYDYDVITDFDLHDDLECLENRSAVIIAGHSEYWSIPAQQRIDSFLTDGGNVVALSGNTMFWRVSFSEDMSVMECRKHAPTASTGAQVTGGFGAAFHSQDTMRGGLLRLGGNPGSAVLGLESSGCDGQFGTYTVEMADHPLFNTPVPMGMGAGEAFGIGHNGIDVVGHEWDVRPSRLGVEQPGSPTPGTELDPAGAVVLASGHAAGTTFWTFDGKDAAPQNDLLSEMIYWKRPQGGRVFYAGTIAFGQVLAHDERISRLLKNVLHHFSIEPAILKRFQGNPCAVVAAENRLDVFGGDFGDTLHAWWWDAAVWQNQNLGGRLRSTPSAVVWGDGRINVFGRAPDDSLYGWWWDGTTWQEQPLGGALVSAPSAVAWGDGRINVFGRAPDDSLYGWWWDGSAWQNRSWL
jgi:hypothetical protein